jgi:hypothetical protein
MQILRNWILCNCSVVSETKLDHRHWYLPNTIASGASNLFFEANLPQLLVWANICALLEHCVAYSCNFLNRHIRSTYRPRLQGSRTPQKSFFGPLKMGPIGCPETSVKNYGYTLRNFSVQRRSYPLCGRSLTLRILRAGLRAACMKIMYLLWYEYIRIYLYISFVIVAVGHIAKRGGPWVGHPWFIFGHFV